ncbi:hypothetical protein N665_2134s0001, partial [Sinapis alba]
KSIIFSNLFYLFQSLSPSSDEVSKSLQSCDLYSNCVHPSDLSILLMRFINQHMGLKYNWSDFSIISFCLFFSLRFRFMLMT